MSSRASAVSSAYCDRECTATGWRKPFPQAGDSTEIGRPPIVALGKFDALHLGHRSLAIAAAELGGSPWLVSFSGMAEVLGWHPRLPLVAAEDRKRVLNSWSAVCGGVTPRECYIPFKDIRTMSPESFINLLANELKVKGIVVGRNYRFGYKAAGTADLLEELGPTYGLKIGVVDLVSYGSPTHSVPTLVSSSEVRKYLAKGSTERIHEILGRPYRIVYKCCEILNEQEIKLLEPQNEPLEHAKQYQVEVSQGITPLGTAELCIKHSGESTLSEIHSSNFDVLHPCNIDFM